jgi:nicotinamidase-related amidase
MRALALSIPFLVACAAAFAASGSERAGKRLTLHLRRQVRGPDGAFAVRHERVVWDAAKTAAIVCDMWDRHWCKGATRRVAEMAPRMDELLARARASGVLVIHAPSGTMKHYRDHPARKRARAAPRAKDLPADIGKWCRRIDAEKGATWPVDQADGGCDCQPKCKTGSPWRKQIETIRIQDVDAVSDSGEEVWNLLAERGIEHVILMGVHTNMCVIGRPFGLRNLVRCGKDVVLVRDLTDTMYNSRCRPFVSHFRGTELVVEYIERHVCPTIVSTDLTGKRPLRFGEDRRPHVLFAIAEREYRTWETLPAFAADVLANACGCRVTILRAEAKNRNVIPALADELAHADLLFLSIRRRALPERDLAALRRYLAAGGPVVAVRTSSHAFHTRGKHPKGHAEWQPFDREVLGGFYQGHHGSGPKVAVTVADGAKGHAILAGVPAAFSDSGSLYRSAPLGKGAQPLLIGTIPGKEPEPVAWTHTYKGGRVFYTSLGHPDGFKGKQAPVVRLLTNAVFWAMKKPVPK